MDLILTKAIFMTYDSFKKGGWKRVRDIILSILFFILILPSAANASESLYEQHIANGIMLIEEGDQSGAVSKFREALKEKPDDFKATLYLGAALSRLNDKDAEAMLRKALYLKPDDPRANLELGIHHINNSKYNEAKGYLEKAIKTSDDTELKDAAAEYLNAAKAEGKGRKRWAADISLGGQYDSNVSLNPNEVPLPQGISRKDDWRAVLNINGRYDFLSTEAADGSIGYNLYQSLHSKLTDFNISYHLLDLSALYVISSSISLKGMYSFEYVFVGGSGYDYAHTASPSIIITEGNRFATIVEYRYRYKNFIDSELYASNSERTGSNHLAGITQNITYSLIHAKIGYAYDRDLTNRSYWDYNGHKGFIGIEFNLPYRILLELYGEYSKKDYDGINPLSDTNRADNAYTLSASATKELTDIFSITVGYFYLNNDSNIALYKYNRAITSLFVNARF